MVVHIIFKGTHNLYFFAFSKIYEIFLDSGKWNAAFWQLDLDGKVESCTVGLGSGNFEGKCCESPLGFFTHYNAATNCCNEDGAILSIGECT